MTLRLSGAGAPPRPRPGPSQASSDSILLAEPFSLEPLEDSRPPPVSKATAGASPVLLGAGSDGRCSVVRPRLASGWSLEEAGTGLICALSPPPPGRIPARMVLESFIRPLLSALQTSRTRTRVDTHLHRRKLPHDLHPQNLRHVF